MKKKMLLIPLALLLAMSLVATGCPAPAPEKVELGFSSTLAPGSCLELAADKFKEGVEEISDGRITITRYPAGELYGPKDEIEAVAAGEIELGMLHVAFVGGRSPVLEFIGSFGAFGCWENPDHFWRFIDMPEVQELAASEFEAKLNAKLLAMPSYGGNMAGTSDKPIRTIEDFKGLKVRSTGTGMALMIKTLGAAPVDMSSAEIYVALQRGTIDAAMTGPSRFYFGKLYEVAPYLTQDYSLPHMSFWLAMNLDAWNKLSAEDQQILSDVAREIEEWSRIYVVKETADVYEEFQRGLAELYFFPKSEVAKRIALVSPVMRDALVETAGSEMAEKLWGFYEAAKE